MSTSPDDSASENQSDAPIFSRDEPIVHPDTTDTTDTTDTPTEQAAQSAEEALPPEAQGEANGGPLGCCLGSIFGLLFGAGLVWILSYTNSQLLRQFLGDEISSTVRIVMFLAAICAMVIFAIVGWRIGKKAYREYEPPPIKVRVQQRQPRLNIQTKTVSRRGAKNRSHPKSKQV